MGETPMLRSFSKHLTVLLAAIFVIGCQPLQKQKHPSTAPYQVKAIARPGDPAPHPLYVVQLDVYQLDVPFGTITGNNDFWSRVDQSGIDPRVSALLKRNGFRIGQGEISQWPMFLRMLAANPGHIRVTSRIAYQEEKEPLLTRGDQPPRNLFYFDAGGQLAGRSFGQSDDLMLLSFWPTPRRDGQVHIQLVPAVQSRDSRMETYTVNGQMDIRTVRPEYFYDLQLAADLDVNHFLIVAPSTEAKEESSLGNAFLLNDGNGGRTETILIFVARPVGAHSLMQNMNAESGN